MKLNDVTTLTHQAVAQALGETYMTEHGYIEAIPADKLVDVGKDLLDGEFTAEKFTKSLGVLMAYREIIADDFKPLFSDIMVDRVEWGGYIERSYIDFADIMDDPMLNLVDGTSYADIEHTFYQPKVSTKLYDEGKGIMIPISIQRSMLFEAFKDYSSMNSFLSKIRSKVRDTLRLGIDRYAAILVSAGIAVSKLATKTAVYLLDETDALGITQSGDTAADALKNSAFLRYLAERFETIESNMQVPSTAYNNGTYAIGAYETLAYMNTQVAKALKFNLYADTFNRNDVKISYKEIPMWQSGASSTANDFDFATASKIMFAADPNNKLGLGTAAVTVENVAGILMDKRAIGMTVFKEYMTNSYTASADFWNEFIHSLTNQILDSTFPMVAFLIDRAPTSQQ